MLRLQQPATPADCLWNPSETRTRPIYLVRPKTMAEKWLTAYATHGTPGLFFSSTYIATIGLMIWPLSGAACSIYHPECSWIQLTIRRTTFFSCPLLYHDLKLSHMLVWYSFLCMVLAILFHCFQMSCHLQYFKIVNETSPKMHDFILEFHITKFYIDPLVVYKIKQNYRF
jgi:hypothetical protein